MNEQQIIKRTPAAGVTFRLFTVAALLGLSVSVFAGSISYTYDALGRVKTATYSNGVVVTYTYDATGNRVSQITTGVP